MPSSHYLWLLPQQSQAEILQRIILDLSRGYGGPFFSPHLTLASGDHDVDIERIFNDIHALKLSCLPPAAGSDPFKCVMLPLKCSTELSSLSAAAGESLQPSATAPHISLLYDLENHIPLHRRIDVSTHLSVPFTEITFDRIALIRGGRDVRQWRTLQTILLEPS